MTGHRLIAYTHARDDPAARFRLRQYVPRFERAGWSVSHRPCRPERPWASPFSVAPLRWIHQRAGVASRRWRRRRDIADAAGYDAAFVNRDLLEGRIENEAALIRRNPRVLFDFDDAFTGPLHGFEGADDYWRRASSRPHLSALRIPTLLLNARNDPFVPASVLPTRAEVPDCVTLWQPGAGGHAGFAGGHWPGQLFGMPRAVTDWMRATCATMGWLARWR